MIIITHRHTDTRELKQPHERINIVSKIIMHKIKNRWHSGFASYEKLKKKSELLLMKIFLYLSFYFRIFRISSTETRKKMNQHFHCIWLFNHINHFDDEATPMSCFATLPLKLVLRRKCSFWYVSIAWIKFYRNGDAFLFVILVCFGTRNAWCMTTTI